MMSTEEQAQAAAGDDASEASRESSPETADDRVPGEGAPASPEELQLMLEDARGKADEHWDALLRARAELENLRKRIERDVEHAHKYGVERLVSDLLPVWDSMELGLSAAADEQVDVAKVREGIELTLKMLSTALEKAGVVQIDPRGQPFDPELHQAMTMQESNTTAPGHVVTVVQKGYVLNDRLVRPALVMVAKQPENAG